MGKEPIDLSAMYIVRHAYSDKATKFVRLHGSMNFAVGGAFCDVMRDQKLRYRSDGRLQRIELR